MLPGKKYTPEDLIKILRKRFWVIVLPWALVAAGTAAAARQLPDLYRSTATIQAVPPQVPESIVRSLNNVSFTDRLQATQQTILSRTRLERVIQDFDLYKEERNKLLMEEVVEKMRQDIKVLPGKGDTFTVQYIGRDPVTVLNVTARLAGYFKEESSKEGERKAEGTNSFVESAVEAARLKLLEVEDRKKNYMMQHQGELPTQLTANVQAVATITNNLNAIDQSLNADTDAKARIERDIQALEAQADPGTPVILSGQGSAVPGSAAQKLAVAKQQLSDALSRGLSAGHPEVRRLTSLVETLTREADAEAARIPVGSTAALSPAEQARLGRLATLHDDLELLTKRIETNQNEQKRLRDLAASYQTKIDRVPMREAELLEITREYDTLNKNYQTLVSQREAANMSVNLERRQIGEQFNLIDQARLPEKPFSPDRVLINLAGLFGGFAIGLALVALLEYRDDSFKTDYEISGILGLPVLAVVPLMRSDDERRVEFRKRLFMNVGFGGAVMLCMAVLAYTFVR